MKNDEAMKTVSATEELLSDAGVDLKLFSECDCPRVLSLLEGIYQPLNYDHFNFSDHLLESVLYELSQGHVSSQQAVAMYLRILEIHENNLEIIDSLKDSNLVLNLDSFRVAVVGSFSKFANRFHLESRKYNGQSGQVVIKQQLCREALVNRVVGKK